MSLSHIFKNNTKHILSLNSFVMSHIKFILAMHLPLDNSYVPGCYSNLVAMATNAIPL